jgi:hypothetical protein
MKDTTTRNGKPRAAASFGLLLIVVPTASNLLDGRPVPWVTVLLGSAIIAVALLIDRRAQ